nr:ribonuclease H-like domain-containing protein [Lachnospiraceae bacterium]
MKIIREKYNAKLDNEASKYVDSNTCLLDIETTGFNRKTCHIYMIGLARKCSFDSEYDSINPTYDSTVDSEFENAFEITLLFSEDETEEKDILQEFLNYSKDIKSFITFNGLSFDFPFIKSRMELYGIPYNFLEFNHIDIFKCCKNLKELLKLENCKQKTIERFLGINREDIYSGGELINQYKSYSKTKDPIYYHNLITHNLEDVRGMIDLLVILRYTKINSLIDKNSSARIDVEKDKSSIKVSINLICTLPNRFVIKSEFYYIVFENDKIKILLSPTDAEMKYFLVDNKNYRYLVNEDIIIPVQLLNSSNKKYAKSVSKENCFIKANGLFLPIYEKDMFENEKLYRREYKDK